MKRFRYTKRLALLISLLIILTTMLGSTLAYVVAKTPSLINTFLSGLLPTGSLTISKTVTHPFGENYIVPYGLSFDFTVDLGEKHANETIDDYATDAEGKFDVTVSANGSITIEGIPAGVTAVVTEKDAGAAFPGWADNQQEILIENNKKAELAFNNPYTDTPEPAENTLTVTGVKELTGRAWMEGDLFRFAVKVRKDGGEEQLLGNAQVEYVLVEQPDPEDPEKTILVPKDGFDRLDFTDMIRAQVLAEHGTYVFEISEIQDPDNGSFVYAEPARIQVVVEDTDMDGKLEVTSVSGLTTNVRIDGNGAVFLTFVNRYVPVHDDVVIEISKTLIDHSGQNKAPQGFVFELLDKEGNQVMTSQPTDSEGKTSITLTYEYQDKDRYFHYILQEYVDPENSQKNMDYDDTAYDVWVVVVENEDGSISASMKIEKIGESEENAGAMATEETIPEETLPEETQPEQTQPAETEPTETEETMPAETEPAETETSGTQPEVTEPAVIEFVVGEVVSNEAADTVAEESPATEPTEAAETQQTPEETEHAPTQPGETQSEEEKTESKPAAAKSAESNSRPAAKKVAVGFVNEYNPKIVTLRKQFEGVKKLDGRTLRAGEFAFELYETQAGFSIPEGALPRKAVVNDSEGKFSFGEITFDKVGQYYFVIKEQIPEKQKGITYDTNTFNITVTVMEDAQDGELEAFVSVKDRSGKEAELVFTNVYTPIAASVFLPGEKTLEGRELQNKEFSFGLYHATYQAGQGFKKGELIKTTTNDVSVDNANTGSFGLEIPCTEAGTYYYIIAELQGNASGVTYDDTQYGIEVTVTDNGEGALSASVHRLVNARTEASVDKVTFTNEYVKPAETTESTETTETTEPDNSGSSTPTTSGSKLPQTGQLWWPAIILAVLGTGFVIAGLVSRKRKDEHEE